MQESLIAQERPATREITFEQASGEFERTAQAVVKSGRQLDSAARARESGGARLPAYPSIPQVLPNDLAVRIDRKRVSAIRPTHPVHLLLADQNKKPRFQVERFVQSLCDACKFIAHERRTAPTVWASTFQLP